MFVGMLTGRPEEEMSGSSGDLLQELSQLDKRARQAMRSVAKALWPSASPPGSMEELVQLFRGARRRFRSPTPVVAFLSVTSKVAASASATRILNIPFY